MLEKLLKDDLVTFYWIGYLLADGYFGKSLQLYSINLEQIEKIAKHLDVKFKTKIQKYGYNIGSTIYYISICDIKNIRLITKKFDIQLKKTYNPPDFNKWNFTNDQLLSLFIGFIDGDGSIAKRKGRNDFLCRIKTHSSWESWFKNFSLFLTKEIGFKVNSPIIDKKGYCVCNITNTEVLKYLKKFYIKHNLPIIDYKWDIVDLSFVSQKQRVQIYKNEILNDLKNKISINKICKKYKTSYQSVIKLRDSYS